MKNSRKKLLNANTLDYRQLCYLILFILFPFVTGVTARVCLGELTEIYFTTSIFFASIQIIPFILFPKIFKLWTVIYFLIFHLPALIDLGHTYLFNAAMDLISVDTLINSNSHEMKEFFSHFWDLKFIFFISFFLSISIFLCIKTVTAKIKIPVTYRELLLCVFSYAVTVSTFSAGRYILPTQNFIFACCRHIEEVNFLKKKVSFGPIKNLAKTQDNCTYVIVIGESATREHFSLYGYERPTTPQIEKIKNDLYIFDNITSATCHTTAVLKGVLSFGGLQNGNIISFFKAAGFKTFWLSNQFTNGEYNDIITIVGHQADVSRFVNERDIKSTQGNSWDELLLPFFSEALNDKSPKKVIFLHLIGSHIMYKDRYPKEFAIFEDNRSENKQHICEYDNTILYTDSLLVRFISLLKQKNEYSYLLYFSDHGEDVRDSPDCIFCHNAAVATPAMFTIPLFVWVSDKYKSENSAFIQNWNLHRPYTTDKMVHSMIRLSRLDNYRINDNFSLFSPHS